MIALETTSPVVAQWLRRMAPPTPRREDHPLRLERKRRGWTLRELAKRTAATPHGRVWEQQLSDYELRGQIPLVAGRCVLALSAAFELPVETVEAWFERRRRVCRQPTKTTTLHPLAWKRIERGLFQRQLGARLGVKQQTIAHWEAERHKPPRSLWPRIARVLGVELVEVEGWFNGGWQTNAGEELAEIA